MFSLVKIAVLLLLARAMRRSKALDLFPVGALAQTAHKCYAPSARGLALGPDFLF